MRYLHTLTYSLPQSGGEYNEDTGGWNPVIPGATIEIPCRAKPNGAGKEIKTGGITQVYSYDLGFPKGTAKIPENTHVVILGIDGEPLYDGVMIQFQEGERSVRGWV